MGEMGVPDERYYGAQTARSLRYFAIGEHKMPQEVIDALILVKKASAIVNGKLESLDLKKSALIVQAIDQLIKEKNIEDLNFLILK